MKRCALLIAVVALGAPPAAGAATIAPSQGFFGDSVNAGDGNCSLREAIEIANDDSIIGNDPACEGSGTFGDDTVQLEQGTYVLDIDPDGTPNDNRDGDLDVTTAAGSLEIIGAGASHTKIDPGVAPPWADRVLHQITGSETLTVADLTVTGGGASADSAGGGGILSSNNLALRGVRVTGNAANGNGAGVRGNGASLSIANSTISANIASGTGARGGGIRANAVTTTIDSTVIEDNQATGASPIDGGGVFGLGANLTIRDSVVANNHVIDSDGSPGALQGGGISVVAGSATVRGTTISGNSVSGANVNRGGGLDVTGATTTVQLVNSTVSGNEGSGFGATAGVRADDGTVAIAHTTLASNTAGPASGASLALDGTSSIRGSVVEAEPGEDACLFPVTSLDGNVFTDSSCGTPLGGDEVDADPQLGPLADNGGPDAGAPGLRQPLLTHVPAALSTAVDHVPAANCLDVPSGSLTVDQRGLPRPDDGDGDSLFDCEAGAVELQIGGGPPPPPPPPPVPGTAVPLTPTTDDPRCGTLSKKLKKAKKQDKRKKARKLRRKLRRLGCP